MKGLLNWFRPAKTKKQINDLNSQIEYLRSEIKSRDARLDRMMADLSRERELKIAALNRLSKFEVDARNIVTGNIGVQIDDIKKDAVCVIVSTPNVSLVNHGTFAQVADKIKRACPKLDALIMVLDKVDVKQFDVNQLADEGLILVPKGDDWVYKKDNEIKKIVKLIDQKYGCN